MSGPDPVRVTVPTDTFETWRRVAPGLAVPTGREPIPRSPDQVLLPTAVATAFGVHAEAEIAVELGLSRGALEVTAHGGVAGDLAAVVVQVRHGTDAAQLDWVQVVLLAAVAVPGELLAWLPDPDSGASMSGSRVRVAVTRLVEQGRRLQRPSAVELARWEGRTDGWADAGGRVGPDGPRSDLRSALRSALIPASGPGGPAERR